MRHTHIFIGHTFMTLMTSVINRKLKRLAGNGKISFPTACRKLRSFKEEYLMQFYHKVKKGNLNKRRTKIIMRETNLHTLVNQFSDSDWFNPDNIIMFAKKFSRVSSVVELIPRFEEHSDIGPDQTIPNFNETVYTEL